MNYINPAILPALIASALPVLIHLLNRQRRKNIDFSTLRFLKKLEKKRMRRVRITEWLLLLLRTLAVFFIIYAFTRPVLNQSPGVLQGESQTEAVLLLDNSISSGITTPRGSALSRIISLADETLKIFSPGDRITVLAAAEPVLFTGVSSLPGNDPRLRKSLFELNRFDSAPDWTKSLLPVFEQLDNSLLPNKEIYLFSTFLHHGETLDSLLDNADDAIKIFLLPVDLPDFRNSGIIAVSKESEIIQPGTTVALKIRLRNFSRQAENDVPLDLFVENERVASRNIALPAGEISEFELKFVPDKTGFISGSVRLQIQDDLPADNAGYFNFYLPKSIPVFITGDSLQSRLIETALNPRQSDDNPIVPVTGKNPAALADLPPETVIIAGGLHQASSYFTTLVNSRLQNGAGLIILPSEDIDAARFNREFLTPLKLPRLLELISSANGTPWDFIDFAHPLFRGIFLDEAKLQSPRFTRYFNLAEKSGAEIIGFSQGNSFLREIPLGEGKVLFFTAGVSSVWGDFNRKAIFAPLLFRSVMYLSAKSAGELKTIVSGKPISEVLAKNDQKLTIHTPGGREFQLIPAVSLNNLLINYAHTGDAGNYRLFSGDELSAVYSVNPAADFTAEPELPQNRNTAVLSGANPADIASFIQSTRYGAELWKHFLILGLFCLSLELIIVRLAK